MLSRFGKIIVFLSALQVVAVHAAPSTLIINKQERRTKDKYIFSAHKEISHNLPIERIPFVLLDAAIGNIKIKWVLEEEGRDFMSFRWDYRGNAIITRVEFDENLIQLKYDSAYGDYVCFKNIEGICYKNDDNDYYQFMKRFRTSITNSVNTYQGG